MATRANVHFNSKDFGTEANIYHHLDGDPDSMLKEFEDFFTELEKATNDTRYNDASYLSAKYVVFLMEGKIDNIGVGIMNQDAGDIEYCYTVNCDSSESRPKIKYKKINNH